MMDTPDGAAVRAPRAPVAFAVAFLAVAAVLVAHNLRLFREPVYEEGETAANSLLIQKAKRLELLHGHYSRIGFYHPGPAALYALAAGEVVLYDWLGAVPAPHNGQMIAHQLLNAALLAVALTVIARATGSGLLALAACAALFAFFARHGHLSSHWFAYLFFFLYLPFQLAAASVAAGRVTHLGWLALTASLCVHAHVTLVAFVVPISLYAIGSMWARGGFKVRTWDRAERRAWAAFFGVVALFVLPLVLHAVLHPPGEFKRYTAYMKHGNRTQTGDPAAAAQYLLATLTHSAERPAALALGVGAGALLAALTFPGRGRAFARQVAVVGLLTSAAMTWFAFRGVDDYRHVYTGVFFGSVLALGWALIAMRAAALCARAPRGARAAGAVALGVTAWAAVTGFIENRYAGAPGAPAVAVAVATDPRWADNPPVLTLSHDTWPDVAGVLLQLDRRGLRPWLVEPHWEVIFTDAFRADDRPVRRFWQIDATERDRPAGGAHRTFGELPGTLFREPHTRAPLGTPLDITANGRGTKAKLLRGFCFTGAKPLLFPIDRSAALLADVGPVPAPHARVTVRGYRVAPSPHPEGQRVAVTINGEPVGTLTFQNLKSEERVLVVPAAVLNRRPVVHMEFEFPDAGGYKARGRPGAWDVYSVQFDALTIAAHP